MIDMRGGLRMATIARNAKLCEEAKEDRCVCSCGGALHGKAHSRKWMQEVFEEARARQFERAKVKAQEKAERKELERKAAAASALKKIRFIQQSLF